MAKKRTIKQLSTYHVVVLSADEVMKGDFVLDIEQASLTLDRLEDYLDSNKHRGPMLLVRQIHGKPIHYIKLIGFCLGDNSTFTYMDHRNAYNWVRLMRPYVEKDIEDSTLGVVRVQFLYLYDSAELFPNHNE